MNNDFSVTNKALIQHSKLPKGTKIEKKEIKPETVTQPSTEVYVGTEEKFLTLPEGIKLKKEDLLGHDACLAPEIPKSKLFSEETESPLKMTITDHANWCGYPYAYDEGYVDADPTLKVLSQPLPEGMSIQQLHELNLVGFDACLLKEPPAPTTTPEKTKKPTIVEELRDAMDSGFIVWLPPLSKIAEQHPEVHTLIDELNNKDKKP